MRIVEINIVNYGSTGKIMLQISEIAREKGHEAYTFSRAWKNKKGDNGKHFFFGSFVENVFHRVFGEIVGLEGVFTYFGTKKLIKKLKEISPDVIHLHNIHGWYISFRSLFKYIKKNNVKVVWTLHDCWAFTGHCAYFDMVGCEKWKEGCFSCPQFKAYPKTCFDNSKKMFALKKKWFCGVSDLTIVTPSEWLAGLVRESFLGEYAVKVINNGIDLDVFKPYESEFRKKHNCENKFLLLGVAFGWGERKGLDVFVELSKRLDERFKVVLVGTSEKHDEKLPKNIISIHKTQNQRQLAEIYSTADAFVNPTREENYPTVNMEAIACGTPVITFNTGGSSEMLDSTCGVVVEKNDIDEMEREIIRLYESGDLTKENCLKKAQSFDKKERFKEYVRLYEEL